MGDREVATVLAWHGALNDGDVVRLVELSSADIEVGGPRGPSRGVQMLREWVERANIRLEPGQVYRRGQTVVVEQNAVWRTPDTGEVIGNEVVASVFAVQSGRVTSVHRHPDLATALDQADLGRTDRA